MKPHQKHDVNGWHRRLCQRRSNSQIAAEAKFRRYPATAKKTTWKVNVPGIAFPAMKRDLILRVW